MASTYIQQISPAHPDVGILRVEAARQGFGFLDRLVDDWVNGSNRFDAPGEHLLGAFLEERLVGICGLNHEPYDPAPGRTRLRHLYVLGAYRRQGVAKSLVSHLVKEAAAAFSEVRLRTDPP